MAYCASNLDDIFTIESKTNSPGVRQRCYGYCSLHKLESSSLVSQLFSNSPCNPPKCDQMLTYSSPGSNITLPISPINPRTCAHIARSPTCHSPPSKRETLRPILLRERPMLFLGVLVLALVLILYNLKHIWQSRCLVKRSRRQREQRLCGGLQSCCRRLPCRF